MASDCIYVCSLYNYLFITIFYIANFVWSLRFSVTLRDDLVCCDTSPRLLCKYVTDILVTSIPLTGRNCQQQTDHVYCTLRIGCANNWHLVEYFRSSGTGKPRLSHVTYRVSEYVHDVSSHLIPSTGKTVNNRQTMVFVTCRIVAFGRDFTRTN